jgi:hypothetical protein
MIMSVRKSAIFWAAMLCNLGSPMFQRNILPYLSLPPTPGFLLGLLFDPEDSGDMFLKNVWLSPNYMALQPQLFIVHRHGNLNSDSVNHYFIMHFTTLLSFLISGKKVHLICDSMARLQEPLMPLGLQS